RMGWILLTNDDGIDSPALRPFARALRDLGEVRVVVPDRERSWVGKAITRYHDIEVNRIDDDGFTAWTTSGYPADTAQIGIHGLFEEPPELVVSGINLGYNHGAAFLMSSGTVGAATEGWISGIPAIAVSTGTMTDWHEWRGMAIDVRSQSKWRALSGVTSRLIGELWDDRLPDRCDVVTINIPFEATDETERRHTKVARVGYDQLFERVSDGVFRHSYRGGMRNIEPLDGSDIEAAHDGVISITPLRMPEAVD
ncbi:MAG: 5'/3'-nucleotidase SurE, partial [Acidimicrobiia bacterium]|nr:5'/3'-nucleotidase SurE [Acidimicrobiia bacterium]